MAQKRPSTRGFSLVAFCAYVIAHFSVPFQLPDRRERENLAKGALLAIAAAGGNSEGLRGPMVRQCHS